VVVKISQVSPSLHGKFVMSFLSSLKFSSSPTQDTDLDPYDSNRGLLWTHLGWLIFKTDLHSGAADISYLRKDSLIQFQHRWYFTLVFVFGFVLPTVVPGLLWSDWMGGFCFAAALRLTIAHHVGKNPVLSFIWIS